MHSCVVVNLYMCVEVLKYSVISTYRGINPFDPIHFHMYFTAVRMQDMLIISSSLFPKFKEWNFRKILRCFLFESLVFRPKHRVGFCW